MKRLVLIIGMISAIMSIKAQVPMYEVLVDSADVCIKNERWADAERFIVDALRLEPGRFSNALLLSNLGVARTRQGKYNEALEAFNTGLNITPRSTVLFSNRASTFMEMGDMPHAIADLTAALEIDPTLDNDRKTRGILYIIEGRSEEATEDLSKYLEASPKDVDALLALADLLAAEGKSQEALIYYERALDNEKEDPDIYFFYAITLAETGRLSEALEIATEGVKAFPDNGNMFLARAWVNKLLYRPRESEADKKIALDNGADSQFVQQFFRK